MNALILCNGLPPTKTLLDKCLQQADLFIAADGGANIAGEFGQTPDVIVGDMDSYEPIERFSAVKVVSDPDQYSNDLEKALSLAKKKEATHIEVLGATGQRLDHTLKNLSVLKQFDAYFNQIKFLDNEGMIKLLPKEFEQHITIGTSLSLFPLSGKVSGVTIRGLKYELTDDILENGVQDGSSNRVVSNPVTIQHKKGDLLLFINRKSQKTNSK